MRRQRKYKIQDSTGLIGLAKCSSGLEGVIINEIENVEFELSKIALRAQNEIDDENASRLSSTVVDDNLLMAGVYFENEEEEGDDDA